MYRIKDIEALTQPNNYMYGIHYDGENGEALEEVPEYLYAEAMHRELVSIVLIDEYEDETKMPQIIFVVKDGDENIHYTPELVQPITLKDFFTLLECIDDKGDGFIANCNVPFDSDTLVCHFHLAADPERKKPPTVEIETSTQVYQFRLPDDFDIEEDD